MKNKIRVLVIDSDKEQLSSIEKYFSTHAVIEVIKVFLDGKEAYDYIRNNKEDFDIIITDLLLPNKDGISLIKDLKENLLNDINKLQCEKKACFRLEFYYCLD